MALDPFGPSAGLDPSQPVAGLDPFAPDPLQGRSTRNLVRETWPQIGTMTARSDGRMSRSILGAPARSGGSAGRTNGVATAPLP